MIKLIHKGKYQLLETKNNTKILILNNDEKLTYAWINAQDIGEILVTSHKDHSIEIILALGNFKLYKVEDEPDLVDTYHLELEIGEGKVQGYLLPTGLPGDKDKRNRIIPTKEIIQK